jgi:hypothetical protein
MKVSLVLFERATNVPGLNMPQNVKASDQHEIDYDPASQLVKIVHTPLDKNRPVVRRYYPIGHVESFEPAVEAVAEKPKATKAA